MAMIRSFYTPEAAQWVEIPAGNRNFMFLFPFRRSLGAAKQACSKP
jgi:hypothetical protein